MPMEAMLAFHLEKFLEGPNPTDRYRAEAFWPDSLLSSTPTEQTKGAEGMQESLPLPQRSRTHD